jgi:hypothetical protein
VPWSRRFHAPIDPPKGTTLVTLKDAADHIVALPATVAKTEPWQLALYCLIEAAEDREPVLHARIAVLRALNHGKPAPAPAPRRKRALLPKAR